VGFVNPRPRGATVILRRLMQTTSGFNCWQMVWANARTRPARTALCVVGVALQVLLIVLIVGMIDGELTEWAHRVEGVGADLLVRPPGSSIFFSLSAASVPEQVADEIARVPGVRVVAPVLIAVEPTTLDIVYGIDPDTFNALGSGFRFLAGRIFTGPREVVVDDIKARTAHLQPGQHIVLLGQDFTVSGIVQSGRGARLFIPLRTAQELAGADHRVSMFYVSTDGATAAVARLLENQLPGYHILSMEEYLTLMNSSNLPDLQPFVRSMIGLGLSIGFLVVFLTTYTVILERTREIGILKSLGASRGQIIGLLLRETILVAMLGAALGLLAAWGVRAVLHREVPALTVLMSLPWMVRAVLLALIAALAGALYPALRAAGFDPVEALAYE